MSHHGDYTGQSKAALAQQFQEQQRLAASQMSLVTQVVEEGSKETVDLFTEDDYRALEALQDPDSDEVTEVGATDDRVSAVKFRARESLEGVTIGKDRTFTLQEGRTYTAPRWVVDHLDEKQLVWH